MVTSGPGARWSVPAPQAISASSRVARFRLSAARISSLRLGPAEPHAALRGVHRLGDAEPEVPQPVPELQRRVPVDRGREPRIVAASGSATTCAAA